MSIWNNKCRSELYVNTFKRSPSCGGFLDHSHDDHYKSMISSQELCTVRPLLYLLWVCTWWRHQMEKFSALLVLCAANSPVSGEFPAQRPMTRSFDVFFDLRLTKRLRKHSRGWWFETLSRSLSRHCNDLSISKSIFQGHFVGTVLQHKGAYIAWIHHRYNCCIGVILLLLRIIFSNSKWHFLA